MTRQIQLSHPDNAGALFQSSDEQTPQAQIFTNDKKTDQRHSKICDMWCKIYIWSPLWVLHHTWHGYDRETLVGIGAVQRMLK